MTILIRAFLVAVCSLTCGPTWAQDEKKPADQDPAAAQENQPGGKFRKLAPGIENTIPPDTQKEEAFHQANIIHLLERDDKFGERPWSVNLAKDVRISSNIWALEYTFKPCGMIWLDVPVSEGKTERKLIWYCVYRVKNTGDEPVRFVPRVMLHCKDPEKYYGDRIIPLAMAPIQKREDPNRKLLNSVEMSEKEIPPSPEGEDNSVWGVFMWEDIDPKTDEFSILIQGLTNAYRREPIEDENGKPQWRFFRKTLQINFWRPSDEFFENEREIRFGVPNKVEYEWVYR